MRVLDGSPDAALLLFRTERWTSYNPYRIFWCSFIHTPCMNMDYAHFIICDSAIGKSHHPIAHLLAGYPESMYWNSKVDNLFHFYVIFIHFIFDIFLRNTCTYCAMCMKHNGSFTTFILPESRIPWIIDKYGKYI